MLVGNGENTKEQEILDISHLEYGYTQNLLTK